jgi:hypothetical protein
VAAALPGMDSTENKPPEDSILFYKNQSLLFASIFPIIFQISHKHDDLLNGHGFKKASYASLCSMFFFFPSMLFVFGHPGCIQDDRQKTYLHILLMTAMSRCDVVIF